LPEEQYNIKSLPQLLEAIAAKVRGADWFGLSLCVRYSPGGCRLGRGGENFA